MTSIQDPLNADFFDAMRDLALVAINLPTVGDPNERAAEHYRMLANIAESAREQDMRSNTCPDPRPDGQLNYRRATLENGQTIVLRCSTMSRSSNGTPLIRADSNGGAPAGMLLPPLVLADCRPASPEKIHETLQRLPQLRDALADEARLPWEIMREEDEDALATILCAESMLRYCRKDFDELPWKIRMGLIEGVCKRIFDLLEANRRLMNFLEYGQPGRDTRLAIENLDRDLAAAVLREVEGLTYREIAQELGVSVSKSAEAVSDYSTVSKMVSRGKEVLEKSWGEHGWREQVQALKAEAEACRRRPTNKPELSKWMMDYVQGFTSQFRTHPEN